MNDVDIPAPEPTETSSTAVTRRRTALKGAAWSLPVIAAAVTAPTVAASITNLSLAWTASSTSLLNLVLLDEPVGGTVTATALTTVPTQLTVSNGPGAVNEQGTLTISVARPAGLTITVGRGRGFGVRAFNGQNSTTAERSFTYINNLGLPTTSFSRQITVNVPSNASVNYPVVFGLAGTRAGLTVDVLANFAVTASLTVGGRTITANSSINVPVGAGLL